MENKELPKEEGYYWVKTGGRHYYNGIVSVYGESPFFRLYGYDFSGEIIINNISEIEEFGDKIIEMK
jgi:hypothetical protein